MEKLRNRVIELLNYDPATGVFTRKIRRGRYQAGEVAESLCHGYTAIRVDGKLHSAHRLAFLVVNGYLPKEIDHINGNKIDNRIENLRPSTRQENKRYTGKKGNNTSGQSGQRCLF